jgi:putative transposase
MPRGARHKSESGIYHIILRGQNKQIIFEDEEDSEKFIQTMEDCKHKSKFRLYGYCLIGNHVHLLLHEVNEKTEIIMRRLGASYVYWYNWKYRRCGHLFQDRYKSETVETDAYFLTVLRYIHRNPVKAGLVKKASEYRWSSFNDYAQQKGITDIDYALSMIDENRKNAVESFVKYHETQNEDACLDIEESLRLTDEDAKYIIRQKYGISSTIQIRELEKEKRNKYLAELKQAGLSTRQLERLTGLGRSIILRA